MLEAIPVTDDAMEGWIMYLEIQAQQQCEEQFSGLKVRITETGMAIRLENLMYASYFA